MSIEQLQGKVAFVAGGGRGIGRAVALAFARQGARVAVAARTLGEVRAVARECGAGAVATEMDIAKELSCVDAVRTAEARLGPIEILVNSAGVARSSKFTELTTEQWRNLMAVDLDGAFWLTKAVIGGMLERRRGAVISIGSVASLKGFAYVAGYVAAKHGLLGLTRALAAEYSASGVTFNCVCPFYVDSPMTEETLASISAKTGRSREAALSPLLTPQGRLIRPEEVAAACVLLASDEGRGITGQAITIDGGHLQS